MQAPQIVNGVNVTQMTETIGAIQQTPTLSQFRFRTENRWIDGGRNRSTIQSFYGAGQEDTTRTRPFVLEADEPPVLLGEDRAPNPVEFVLHALAACLTTSLVYHAAARGIRVESVESRLEGDLDLQGFLGLSEGTRPGFESIRVTFRVQSDASREELEEMVRHSPVYDIVTNPVPVTIRMETAEPMETRPMLATA